MVLNFGINDLDERFMGYNVYVRILIVRKGNKFVIVIQYNRGCFEIKKKNKQFKGQDYIQRNNFLVRILVDF